MKSSFADRNRQKHNEFAIPVLPSRTKSIALTKSPYGWHHDSALSPEMKEAWQLQERPQGRTCQQTWGADTCCCCHWRRHRCLRPLDRQDFGELSLVWTCASHASMGLPLNFNSGVGRVVAVWGRSTACWELKRIFSDHPKIIFRSCFSKILTAWPI